MSVEGKPDVVGVGLSTWDLLFRVSKPPDFGECVDVSSFRQEGGGPAATATVTASRLGTDACFVGGVGGDYYGKLIVEGLREHGVDASWVYRREDEDSKLVVVLVEEGSGERIFISGTPVVSQEEEKVPSDVIEGSEFLLIDSYCPVMARRAAVIARGSDTKVLSDLEGVEEADELLPLTDILIVPESFVLEYESVTDDPVQASVQLLDRGPNAVVVTRGEEGCIVAYGDRVFRKESFEVDVVDTTGAGDAFHGAYAVGMMKGWDYERSAEFASAVSAMNCTTLGGRSGLPGFEEVLEFLAEKLSDWEDIRDRHTKI